VRKNTLSPNHQHLCALLREVRREAGFAQAQLAARIKRDQTFVSKYETGERMLDVLELREICLALGVPLAAFIRRLERRLSK
jgi:transcriptional regulator with XRE-family HTH domain